MMGSERIDQGPDEDEGYHANIMVADEEAAGATAADHACSSSSSPSAATSPVSSSSPEDSALKCTVKDEAHLHLEESHGPGNNPNTSLSLAAPRLVAGQPPPVPRNPYAQRRAPPELYRQPWGVDTESQSNGAFLCPPSELASEAIERSGGGAGQGEVAPSLVELPSDAATRSDPVPDEDGPGLTPAPPPPIAAGKVPQAGVPPWERLPSRNLSFRSAELLSVSECRKHAPLYAAHGSSVRVLGVLVHRLVHDEDATVSLVLQDPLTHIPSRRSTVPTSKRQSSVANREPSRGALSPRGGGAFSSVSPHPTTARTTAPWVRDGAPTPRTKSIIKAQPLRSRTSAAAMTTPNNTSSTSTSEGVLGSRKRPRNGTVPLASKPPPTPLPPTPLPPTPSTTTAVSTSEAADPRSALTASLVGSDTLWVVADPTRVSVQPFVVGDLITVLGELERRDGGPRPVACDPTSVRDGGGDTGSGAPPDPAPERWCVVARILRDSQGTNPALFHQALEARRKMLAKAATATTAETGATPGALERAIPSGSSVVQPPRPGWGPPPYPNALESSVE